MKKGIFTLFVAVFLFSALATWGESTDEKSGEKLKVGMVTDAGTIDDKSFNQGTWEGILMAVSQGDITEKYLKPSGTTEADYIKEISNLYDAGYMFIVTPGFKFETSIFAAQNKYPDAYFVLIDGSPHAGDYNVIVGDNTVSIFFAEHESGFLAGVATALQQDEGEVGFIGGMEIPPVQKFNWGFQQGVNYANENLGTNVVMKEENFIYQGTFDQVAAGQQLAAAMFDKGVDVIFCAAGGVGIGAINEAKSRAKNGEDVWIVGVDVDQFAEGIYEGDKSVILTSAMKKVDNATYDMIQAKLEGSFPGGQTLVFNAANNGVGIPAENPNLDKKVETRVDKITAQVKSGDISVSDEQGNLFR